MRWRQTMEQTNRMTSTLHKVPSFAEELNNFVIVLSLIQGLVVDVLTTGKHLKKVIQTQHCLACQRFNVSIQHAQLKTSKMLGYVRVCE